MVVTITCIGVVFINPITQTTTQDYSINKCKFQIHQPKHNTYNKS